MKSLHITLADSQLDTCRKHCWITKMKWNLKMVERNLEKLQWWHQSNITRIQLQYYFHTVLKTNVNSARIILKCGHMRTCPLEDWHVKQVTTAWNGRVYSSWNRQNMNDVHLLNCFLLPGTFTVTLWLKCLPSLIRFQLLKVHFIPKLFMECNCNKYIRAMERYDALKVCRLIPIVSWLTANLLRLAIKSRKQVEAVLFCI